MAWGQGWQVRDLGGGAGSCCLGGSRWSGLSLLTVYAHVPHCVHTIITLLKWFVTVAQQCVIIGTCQ